MDHSECVPKPAYRQLLHSYYESEYTVLRRYSDNIAESHKDLYRDVNNLSLRYVGRPFEHDYVRHDLGGSD